jgi:hypothetical protein
MGGFAGTVVRLVSGPLRGACLTIPMMDAPSFLVAEYPEDMPGYRAVYEYELDPPSSAEGGPWPAHWLRFVRWEPGEQPPTTPVVKRGA